MRDRLGKRRSPLPRSPYLPFPLSLLLALLLLGGCGGESERPAAEPDARLAEALVTLHLADARAAATGEAADSLRAAAYAHVRRTTGLDSAAVAARLAEAARHPAEAAALFGRVSDSLSALRR